jgi:hypothetical protein
MFDFRPYHIGASIPEQMEVDPELADIYETVFIYQKDGVEKEFTEENYPWNDSTWTFVDMRSRLVREGIKPAIEDFAVTVLYPDTESGSLTVGSDITDQILLEPDWLFLMIAPSLEKMELRHLDQFSLLHRLAEEEGYSFYLLTASPIDVVEAWEARHRTGFRFAIADEKVLKTMIRSNPGLMLLREGVVINKWDDSQLPDSLPSGDSLEASQLVQRGNWQLGDTGRLLMLSLLLLIPLSLLKWLEKRSVRREKN